ncbi:unnamed protein product [Sphenostylis stenocarpa]|uniref:Uncharacterized protein n=1 Tax=Sphenostylis stenocarpa TaxID=92480 RepID=A0AA86SGF0_9FABA|nr:unnamed protein product [Sphenostylis stenocarpa]
MGASHAMKRIPRIKFPQRHPKPSGSVPETQALSSITDANLPFFTSSNVLISPGGKASLQPKRTPVSNEEIEAVLYLEPESMGLGRTSAVSFLVQQKVSLMDDVPWEIKVILNHFRLPISGVGSLENRTPPIQKPGTAKSSIHFILVEGKATSHQKFIMSV